jgi:hypothetical protein
MKQPRSIASRRPRAGSAPGRCRWPKKVSSRRRNSGRSLKRSMAVLVPPPTSVPRSVAPNLPALRVVQGGSDGTGKPTGMLRDTGSPSQGATVDASHPVFKNKMPLNENAPTCPESQRAKVAVNARLDAFPDRHVEVKPTSKDLGHPDAPSMVKKGKPSGIDPTKTEKSGPPTGKLDPGEGEMTKKSRKSHGDYENLPKKEKVNALIAKDSCRILELIARLPDPEDRRAYMKWLQSSHYGTDHPHVIPGKNLHESLALFHEETGIALQPEK